MIKVEDKGTTSVVYIKGEFNAQAGLKIKDSIKECLEKKDIKKFIISFRDIIYINSSGIRELIDLHKFLSNEHKELFLSEMSKEIRELFSFTYLDNVFKIIEKIDEVLE
jgi:anti-sigma B factor antagonist